MAIVGKVLASAKDSANTAAAQPDPYALVLATIVTGDSAAGQGITAPIGYGLTWVQVGTDGNGVVGTDTVRVYRAMGATPTNTVVSWGVTGDQGGVLSIVQFTGVDTTGTNGSGAIVQTKNNTGGSVTLDNPIGVGNGTFGAFVDQVAATVGGGYTLLHSIQAGGAGVEQVFTEWRATGTTTVNVVGAQANTSAIIGIEIKAKRPFPFQTVLLAPRSARLALPWVRSVPAAAATSTNAAAGVATGIGQAYDASTSIAVSPGSAAGTGLANDAGHSISVSGGSAAGTGTANTAAGNVQPNAGVATGTGAAYNPSITATEYQRPIADIATGSWTVAPLWSKVDETTADDTDFITSETLVAPGNTSNADLRMSATGDPLSSVNQIISVRAKVTFTLGLNGGLRAELRQGNNVTSTLISTLTTNALTTSFVTYTATLSGAEADSITDYGDLFIRLYGNFPVGSLGGVTVSWVQFQQPPGVTPDTSVYPNQAAGTGTANQPSISVAGSSGTATGSGAANTPGISVAGTSGNATGTGTANNPAPSVAASPGVATGTGAAYDATPTSPTAHPGVATGIGQAYDPTILIVTPSGATPGSGNTGRRGPHGLSGDELRAQEEDEILVLI